MLSEEGCVLLFCVLLFHEVSVFIIRTRKGVMDDVTCDL